MSNNTYIHSYNVDSLDEFYTVVRKIRSIFSLRSVIDESNNNSQEGSILPLWYRGQEMADYYLVPNLYRSVSPDIGNGAYGTDHLRESYRRQLFQARAWHRVETSPTTQTDWNGIMQHYSMKTRLMDWSESAKTALVFSLEAYLDPTDNHDTRLRRQIISPVVWVLNPVLLNSLVYKRLISVDKNNRYLFIENAIKDRFCNPSVLNRLACLIGKELSTNKKYYFRPDEKKPSASTLGLVNLSALEQLCKYTGNDLYKMLHCFEMNPFFYLLVRYYCDGVPTCINNGLPPLAIVHPYHSDRIHAQSGAFTCFPYYTMDDESRTKMEYVMDPRMMEAQSDIKDCLVEIRIVRPERVAAQLLDSGERISHMYPELERVSKDLEATSYHV